MTVLEEEAFPFARRLATEEGLFVGMSAGGMIYSAVQVAKELGADKRIVTIACDTGARYLSTELFA
jgi:cysteine synthase